MKTRNMITILVLALLTLATVAIVNAGAVALFPSTPSTFTVSHNSTNAGQSGYTLNHSRGYIYYVDVDESAPTSKWKAYVGNITGEFALQDASGNAVYDWTMVTVTGEVYATKEAPSGSHAQFGGGIPTWTNLTCANSSMRTTEEALFNHTTADEDSYSNTFKIGDEFNLTTFYAGERNVNDSSVTQWGGGTETCAGIYLMHNNTDQNSHWAEVVLTDGTYQTPGSGTAYDIIYAGLIENNWWGFDSSPMDFQLLLPESGLQGNQANTVYYFYIELV